MTERYPLLGTLTALVTDAPTILLGYAVSVSLIGGSGVTRNT